MFNVNGVQVNFSHLTPTEIGGAFGLELMMYGIQRVTFCALMFPEADSKEYEDRDLDEVSFGIGVAYCSEEDNFERAVGRKLALTRALRDSDFTKEERAMIWETYNDMVKI